MTNLLLRVAYQGRHTEDQPQAGACTLLPPLQHSLVQHKAQHKLFPGGCRTGIYQLDNLWKINKLIRLVAASYHITENPRSTNTSSTFTFKPAMPLTQKRAKSFLLPFFYDIFYNKHIYQKRQRAPYSTIVFSFML